MSKDGKARSARGEVVDFKLLDMKAKLSAQVPPTAVQERKDKINPPTTQTGKRAVYVPEAPLDTDAKG